MKLEIYFKKPFIKSIRFYQLVISPHLAKSCRFEPSCSEYSILAIEKKGAVKGILLGIWRTLRCNPFCKGGIDVP